MSILFNPFSSFLPWGQAEKWLSILRVTAFQVLDGGSQGPDPTNKTRPAQHWHWGDGLDPQLPRPAAQDKCHEPTGLLYHQQGRGKSVSSQSYEDLLGIKSGDKSGRKWKFNWNRGTLVTLFLFWADLISGAMNSQGSPVTGMGNQNCF